MTLGGDWDRFINATGPGFDAAFQKVAKDELNAVGRMTVRAARAMIRARKYAPNAQRTIDGKHGSTLPLVDTNEMVNRIRHQLEPGLGVRIGTNRTDERGENIAKKLHEGVRRKGGNGWFIPPRPFLTKPANDPVVQKALRDAGMRAVRRALNRPLYGAAKAAHEAKLAREGRG